MGQTSTANRRLKPGDRRVYEQHRAIERRDGLGDRRVVALQRLTIEPIGNRTATATDSGAVDGGVTASPTAGWPPLRAVLVLSDLSCLAAAWFGFGFAAHRWWGRGWNGVAEASVLMVLAGGLMLRQSGLYRTRVSAMRSVELAKLGRVAAGSAAAAYALGFLPRDHASAAVVAGAVTFCVLAVERSVYRAWVRGLRRRGQCLRRVLVVGSAADVDVMQTLITDFPELGYQIGGVVSVPRPEGESTADDGGVAGLVVEQARAINASGLLVATGALPATETAQLLRCALTMGLHVQVWGGLPGIDQRRLEPLPLGHQPAFYLAPSQISDWQLVAKRVLDLTIAPLALLVSAPVLLAIALLVKREDGGPVIFRQSRIGKDGREFTLFKFRSMVVDADVQLSALVDQNERRGPLFKVDRDPRVTRIGKFLRATSLDELPQLVNVVFGEMSLVGPRPALADEVAQFDEELLRRLRVTPGVTGLWQVEGRDNPSFEAYRSLDLFYVENWSLGVDLAILLSTVAVVLGRAVRVLQRRPEARPVPATSLSAAVDALVPEDDLSVSA
jgi:exopolysaccharide biosynthesis polyprenyl glycosylphosphotransferase